MINRLGNALYYAHLAQTNCKQHTKRMTTYPAFVLEHKRQPTEANLGQEQHAQKYGILLMLNVIN